MGGDAGKGVAGYAGAGSTAAPGIEIRDPQKTQKAWPSCAGAPQLPQKRAITHPHFVMSLSFPASSERSIPVRALTSAGAVAAMSTTLLTS